MTALIEVDDISADLVVMFRNAGRVAVDTETSGLDWRTDKLELCQLFAPETGAILVRNVTARASSLPAVLTDPNILKVFHHAAFDLRFLESTWGVTPRPVACTKTASKLLDPGLRPAGHSLAPLLDRYLNVRIGKGAVRTSDWGAARLTKAQLDYAESDVIHLLDLLDRQLSALDARGLREDFTTVCGYLPLDAHFEVAGLPDPLTY